MMNVYGSHSTDPQQPFKIGVVGGGIAGSTIALRLAELGVEVELFEAGASLVNGPPICHLHAGGNLYREISEQQCLTLLHESIDTLRIFPHAANIRPTVIAVPQRDPGDPEALLPRLQRLQQTYLALVVDDPANEVLGDPQQYYKLYSREALEQLALAPLPTTPASLDDWMIPVAKNLEFDSFKFPLVLVQEYGLSVFRLAATAVLAAEQLPSCRVHTQAQVVDIEQDQKTQRWSVAFQQYDPQSEDHRTHTTEVDYLINACGFRTGILDDMAQLPRDRMVEFKAAYITHWADCTGVWPEVIFHGERGTPNGMAQLTPYPEGYFQLHGMTPDITLFKDGLARNSHSSAQPMLEARFNRKLREGWQPDEIHTRTTRAIQHMTQFVPAYHTATVGGNPLFGAQQIPGDDPSLRAADLSFAGQRYARAEIVKASSALSAANQVVKQLIEEQLLPALVGLDLPLEQQLPMMTGLDPAEVIRKAEQLAEERNFPTAMARLYQAP
ncbi:NAD(P)-binding protein [Photobacterium sp. TY1-4]|uniref:NAD(P)-binding protein n=1 Tax=Photobacterium sp. TY1-4 TaxID=2899122 RepID=UPI0028F6C7D4|nr:NAD(P)-binding protein [Photobacterium sp. TY1-4]